MSLQKIKPQYIDLTQSFAGNLTVQGNISSGNISTGNISVGNLITSGGVFWANGSAFSSSSGGGSGGSSGGISTARVYFMTGGV